MRVSVRTLDRLWQALIAPVAVFMMVSFAKQAAVEAHNAENMVDPQAIYAQAWQLIRDQYVDTSFNGQNWSNWEHKFDGKLQSNADAFDAIKTMVASLDDPYTRVAHTQSTPTPDTQASLESGAEPQGDAVTAKVLGNDIGYLKVSSFARRDCVEQIRDSLTSFSERRGVILDLRGNKGGMVINALEVADMLLDKGDIVTTVSRGGKHTYTSSGSPLNTRPLVVLTDGHSASATEILTGALKDNHRAVVIGTRTFGKGLVQSVDVLPGGDVLYVTGSHYLTPNGNDINKVGITPDVEKSNGTDEVTTAVAVLQKS